MNQKSALAIVKKRKKVLESWNMKMIERLHLTKEIQQLNKELRGIDKLILHEG